MSKVVTQRCPSCRALVTMEPYGIGSGPEMSCPNCEWCWGAAGQDLTPYRPPASVQAMWNESTVERE